MRRGLKINDITKRRKINQSGLDNGKKLELNKLKVQLEGKGVQRKILISLGLNKMNRENILEENSAIIGMINKVKHLVKFEKV